MDTNFTAKVNLDLLQKDMDMSQRQIAELVELNEKALYKWSYDKDRGGTRPTYDAIKVLLENGASINAIFGIEDKVKLNVVHDDSLNIVLDGLKKIIDAMQG
ncbi:hypothetical protein SAMN05720766_10976 [Fibrobacter sp. UWH9]|uniref:hypothetical protein n=1 Tax=Fibrobacter sp. UWH9 TaxID=1896213 RepID=UPI0009176093|nr:hypothetical protein [Fibrobacter sp. UWH9]SHH25794.1 hypothetical protein SAMN05720766_10976 [Fibrobacter sp. UWH9]